jgi:NADH-quinone oxidoreductase subunit L
VSAYAGAIFHLMTHAFFKALLFLAAGSVIIAMHHEQDMRKMGGLRKYMPVTYWTCLVGALALIGFPGFAGFFSKDALIEAVGLSTLPAARYGYWCVLIGVFVTAFYTFRLVFMTFHGRERMDEHTKHHLHESPWVVTVPLVLLAIPSVFIGWYAIEPMLIGDWWSTGDWSPIVVAASHDTLQPLREHWHGQAAFIEHGIHALPFYLAMGGLALAALIWWVLHAWNPRIDELLQVFGGPVTRILQDKYGFDDFNQRFFASGSRGLGRALWITGDRTLIDGAMVNGSARTVGRLALRFRHLQTGYLYHYAIAMIVGLVGLLTVFVTL